MATSATLLALPTTLGATLIQANAFNIPTGDYVIIDWKIAQRRVDQYGRAKFTGFPGGKVEDPNVMFLTRTDISGVTANNKTLVAIWVTGQTQDRSAMNTTTMTLAEFLAGRTIERVATWHFVEVTLTNGSKYSDVKYTQILTQALMDPENGAFIEITNEYQALYECLSFMLKQNAAGAPTWEPFHAACSGTIPI